MPNDLQRTSRRGIFCNGYSYYIRHMQKWVRFDAWEDACAFQDEREAQRPQRLEGVEIECRPKANPFGTIYFIAPAGGPIKIGFTVVEPECRLAELQIGSPVPLELVGSRPGYRSDEQWLHGRFTDQRMHGEWFRPTQELWVEIERDVTEEDARAQAPLKAHVRLSLAVGKEAMRLDLSPRRKSKRRSSSERAA